MAAVGYLPVNPPGHSIPLRRDPIYTDLRIICEPVGRFLRLPMSKGDTGVGRYLQKNGHAAFQERDGTNKRRIQH